MNRLAMVLISWLGCAVVIAAAYQALPVPVSAGEALVIHARVEEALAKGERR